MAEATSLRLRIEAPILLGPARNVHFQPENNISSFWSSYNNTESRHTFFYLNRYGMPTLVFCCFFLSVYASSLSIVAGQSGCPSQSLQSNICCCRSFFLKICYNFLELLLEQLI
jgi:hypothetical protein